MIDFDKITYYNNKIKELIEQRPELASLQEELNSKLKDVTCKQERQRIIQEMMLETWYRITKVNI